MRYDLTVPIKDLAGVQITDKVDTEGYTLRSVLVRTALMVETAKLPTAAEKLIAYGLAKRISLANHFIDLSAEEVASLKEKGGIMWSPLVMGQLWELLETPVSFLPDPEKPVDVDNGGMGDGPLNAKLYAEMFPHKRKPLTDIPK